MTSTLNIEEVVKVLKKYLLEDFKAVLQTCETLFHCGTELTVVGTEISFATKPNEFCYSSHAHNLVKLDLSNPYVLLEQVKKALFETSSKLRVRMRKLVNLVVKPYEVGEEEHKIGYTYTKFSQGVGFTVTLWCLDMFNKLYMSNMLYLHPPYVAYKVVKYVLTNLTK